MNPRVVVVNSILIAVRFWFLLCWLVNWRGLGWEISGSWLGTLVRLVTWLLIRLVCEDWRGMIDRWWWKRLWLVWSQLQGQCHRLRVVHQGGSMMVVGTCCIVDGFWWSMEQWLVGERSLSGWKMIYIVGEETCGWPACETEDPSAWTRWMAAGKARRKLTRRSIANCWIQI